jgi:hypothetical protein
VRGVHGDGVGGWGGSVCVRVCVWGGASVWESVRVECVCGSVCVFWWQCLGIASDI